ncbi:hypothetical protein ACT4MC_07340 [Vibrio furnissii]|uniref:hypothetical protein n=1 Tax=Vibrio vulnificus TaxID=672 RepID=UPI003EDA14C5
MGAGAATGFLVAGPLGAAAGAYLANNRDVPIILKHKNKDITIQGKSSDKLIQEMDEIAWFSED